MKHLVVGTAGHIDHGKSALVRALTGTDPDRLKEEKARGITIDLGFAHLDAGGVSFSFVDVPGHERFVKNMLAGVGGIDAVLLVVAANESVMPQTREHFEICRLLRVRRGLVALSKADLVDRETVDLVRLEVRELVARSFMDGVPIVAVSSRTSEGLPELRDELVQLSLTADERPGGGATRLSIDRVFSVRGFGTVVTGTLVSGRIGEDQELLVLPQGRRVKVRGVQVHGVRQPEAVAGQRAAVNLGGVEVADVKRGDSLVAEGAFEATRTVDAALELLPSSRPLRHGARVRFHQGTSELLGRVGVAAPAEGGADAALGPVVQPGGRAFVRLRLESPAVLTRGDRYVLRSYSPPFTIAGGEILDPHPPRVKLRSAAALERFERLGHPTLEETGPELGAVAAMIEDGGTAGFAIGDLVRRAGLRPELVDAAIERLEQARSVVRVGERLMARPALESLKARLLSALADHHRALPLSPGLPREEARVRLFGRSGQAIFERVLADFAAEGRIAAGESLALASHRVSLSDEEARARDLIEKSYREAGLRPLDAGEVAADAGLSPDLAGRVVRLLTREKVLVKVDTLLFHAEALARMKADVAALKRGATQQPARLDVAAFKERYGVSRKYAIPLLEYLDRERMTRRVGDARVIL